MAKKKGGKSKTGKGKKPHKNKPTSKRPKHYKIDGSTIKKDKHCIKCGPGTFLAVHKDRLYCGKCHYTEFTKK